MMESDTARPAAAEQAEAALRDSEARLHGLIHAAMDAIISVDAEQRIRVFNAAAERMFRCPAGKVLGEPLDRLIPSRFREAHRRHVATFAETGQTARQMGALGELMARRADGEEFPIEASISRAEVSGQPWLTVILRDITERKRAETQLRQALAEKELLVREVHHRVKNNLQMLCDLLYLQMETREARSPRDELQDAYARLLAFARLHEQLYQTTPGGEVLLDDYLARLVAGFKPLASPAQVVFTGAPAPVFLDVDRTVLVGVIVNELLTNALKHAFPDGEGRVTLALRAVDDQIEVGVHDTGQGLPAGFTLEQTHSLGLRLVHTLARRLHATVTLEPGAGTGFKIAFPRQAPE